jgi:hypothetical protein
MPDFDFYCAKDEYSRFLAVALGAGNLRYIVDDYYTYPMQRLEEDVSIAAIERILGAKRSVFLAGTFTLGGVAFSRETYGPMAGMYSVDERGMGPLMRLRFPTWFEEQGTLRVTPGYIQMHDSYCDRDNDNWIPATRELQSAYRSAKHGLETLLTKVRFVSSPSWVSPLALSLAAERKISLLDEGKWVSGPLNDLSIIQRG